MHIVVVETDRDKVDLDAWDAFATTCSASFRCSYRASRAWHLDEGRLFITLRHFEIYDGCMDLKIGQCVIGVHDELKIFSDSLQLLPEFRHHWAEIMTELLTRLGPGRYRYGSMWNIESPRKATLGEISGVTVDETEDLAIQAVDFAKWHNWDDYERAVSNNARRSAKRALKASPAPSIKIRRGLSTLFDVITVTRLHCHTASRKDMTSPPLWVLLRNVFRTIAMRKHAVTAIVSSGNCPMAAYAGVEFGQNTYYLLGGSRADNGGAAWLLMLTMIRRAYDRTGGTGKFMMGAVRACEPGWENLSRSREQCRVNEFASSTLAFSYAGPAQNAQPRTSPKELIAKVDNDFPLAASAPLS